MLFILLFIWVAVVFVKEKILEKQSYTFFILDVIFKYRPKIIPFNELEDNARFLGFGHIYRKVGENKIERLNERLQKTGSMIYLTTEHKNMLCMVLK